MHVGGSRTKFHETPGGGEQIQQEGSRSEDSAPPSSLHTGGPVCGPGIASAQGIAKPAELTSRSGGTTQRQHGEQPELLPADRTPCGGTLSSGQNVATSERAELRPDSACGSLWLSMAHGKGREQRPAAQSKPRCAATGDYTKPSSPPPRDGGKPGLLRDGQTSAQLNN